MSVQFDQEISRLAGDIMSERANRRQALRTIFGGSIAVLGAAREQLSESRSRRQAAAESGRQHRWSQEAARMQEHRWRAKARNAAIDRLHAEVMGALGEVKDRLRNARRAWAGLGDPMSAARADQNHELRQRVLMLISSHPAGLTERELERLLEHDHDGLMPLLAAMEADKALHREGAVYFPDR